MKEIEKLLRSAAPPWGETELRRDLWPEMRRRIESARLSDQTPAVRFGLLDWLVAGLVVASMAIFPKLILGLLYQL